MPRAHDRGGRPTDTTIDRTERVLHDWERRIDAIVFALRNKGIASVDQMRLALESLPPTQYETLRYYEKWAATAESNLAAAGIIAPEELDQKMADQDAPIDRANPTLSDWERRIDAIAQLLASKGVVTPQDMKTQPRRRLPRRVRVLHLLRAMGRRRRSRPHPKGHPHRPGPRPGHDRHRGQVGKRCLGSTTAAAGPPMTLST